MTNEEKLIVNTLRECAVATQCSKCVVICGDNECLFTSAAKLIESLSEKNKHLEYTLVGIMHFVDKWLDNVEPYSLIDDPSGQIAIDRAAEARRITLEHIEDLTREMYRRGQELEQVKRERDAAVEDLEMLADCEACIHDDDEACEHCCDVTIRGNWQWRGVQEET